MRSTLRALTFLLCLAAALANLVGCATSSAYRSARLTEVTDEARYQQLLGAHAFSLQWIGWEPEEMGSAIVTEKPDGTLGIEGLQKARRGTDFVSIAGTISAVGSQFFTFDGKIITQVSFIAGGQPVERDGRYRFGIYGTRDYWRMEQRDNPADSVVDYVDIHFR